MTTQWIEQLQSLRDDKQRTILQRFFKTGPGQYGEGDEFFGIKVPQVRTIARQHYDEPLDTIGQMITHKVHECRLCGLLALVERYRMDQSDQSRQDIVEFYLNHTSGINNWDLVDLSCPKILGDWISDHPAEVEILYRLSQSNNMWEQRIAVVSTLSLIRIGRHEPTLRLCEQFIGHPHDLIHKATGWMLREVGKRDTDILLHFLDKHASEMPRTMLRYSLERLQPELRSHYMKTPRNKA